MVDETAFLALEAGMKQQQISWQALVDGNPQITGSSGSASGSNQVGIDAEVMQALQDSFDAVTRLTLAAKRKGQEMVSKGTLSQTLKNMVMEGLAICKELVLPTEAIEGLLLKPMSAISHTEAMIALKEASVPYNKL